LPWLASEDEMEEGETRPSDGCDYANGRHNLLFSFENQMNGKKEKTVPAEVTSETIGRSL
jgi:hypothetical protein